MPPSTKPLLAALALLLRFVPAAQAQQQQQKASSAGAERPNIAVVIADDQSYPHAGAYGDPVARTPAFDRVAREGVLFERAFVAAPSCTPSRGALLTGQDIWRLEEGANLWSALPETFSTYPALLEEVGYFTGHVGKGWGPGRVEASGRAHNPAGPAFEDVDAFFEARPEDRPFSLWLGSYNPHRPYDDERDDTDPERRAAMRDTVSVPPFLPDQRPVRADLLDYFDEIAALDNQLAALMARLENAGELENTLLVVTSDNGMPFPRAKATLYDAGTRVPLAVRWPARFGGSDAGEGRVADEAFVNLTDLAPTVLEAAGARVPEAMTGHSLLPFLEGDSIGEEASDARDFVVTALERHSWSRPSGRGYPARAIRTEDYLYIRNFRPERRPAGHPKPTYNWSGSPTKWTGHLAQGYGDVDPSPTKMILLALREGYPRLFEKSFGERPTEELYVLSEDPHQMNNVAGQEQYAELQARLRTRLMTHLREQGDPRSLDTVRARFGSYPYYGTKSPHAQQDASP